MKAIYLLIFSFFPLFAILAIGSTGSHWQQVDTLVLTHNKTGAVIKIPEGTQMTTKIFGGLKYEGQLHGLEANSIQIGGRTASLDAILSIKFKDPKQAYERTLANIGIIGGLAVSVIGLVYVIGADTSGGSGFGGGEQATGVTIILGGLGLAMLGALSLRGLNIKKYYTVQVKKANP